MSPRWRHGSFSFELDRELPIAISFDEARNDDRSDHWRFALLTAGEEHRLALAVRAERSAVLRARRWMP